MPSSGQTKKHTETVDCILVYFKVKVKKNKKTKATKQQYSEIWKWKFSLSLKSSFEA